jgi:hypothetical protein
MLVGGKLASLRVGQAWEHRGRRRRGIAAGRLLIVLAVAGGLLVGCAGAAPAEQPFGSRYHFEPRSRVLVSGAAFFVSRLAGRDRVVVTIVLRRPPTSVVASVNGRVTDLHAFTSTIVRRSKTGFTGERSLAGITHERPMPGVPPRGPSVKLAVRLLITYGDGSRVATEFREDFKHGI